MSERMIHKRLADPLLLSGKSQIEQQQWKRSHRPSVLSSQERVSYRRQFMALTAERKTFVDAFLLWFGIN